MKVFVSSLWLGHPVVEADTNSNHYKLTADQFRSLLDKNIHKAAKEDLRRAHEYQKEIVVKSNMIWRTG